MKRLILAAGLFAATLTASLHAQTMNMQASIPFDFQIGSTVLPSGEYSIRHPNQCPFHQFFIEKRKQRRWRHSYYGHAEGNRNTQNVIHPVPQSAESHYFTRYGVAFRGLVDFIASVGVWCYVRSHSGQTHQNKCDLCPYEIKIRRNFFKRTRSSC